VTSVLWFRRDLRLSDNPALVEAARTGPVLPLFVLDDALLRPSGPARVAFLVDCLHHLHESMDGRLVIRKGPPELVVPEVAREVGADTVYAAADFGPYGRQRDDRVAGLVRVGSPYASPPGRVAKPDGESYRVFTPFFRAWMDHGWPAPFARPQRVEWLSGVPSVGIPQAPDTDVRLPSGGEKGALERWARFRDHALVDYASERDRPDLDHTSRLSADLKFGTIHPRTLLGELGRGEGPQRFRAELCWREFYADVLWHRPDSARRSLQPKMAALAVDEDEERWAAWAEGRTGYPIVDAGMRQLRGDGWMHNRVRMIVASFLVKDLHLDWRRGARHFMRHLVDGDLASNSHGWQWVAGTGTDPAPYFRVFNPVVQGKKFDPTGEYVRRHVPELAEINGAAVHEPWKLAALPLSAQDYPAPIVDHAIERAEGLARYGRLGDPRP
jgi:deoxyribodipyrimidine photo-lyase